MMKVSKKFLPRNRRTKNDIRPYTTTNYIIDMFGCEAQTGSDGTHILSLDDRSGRKVVYKVQ